MSDFDIIKNYILIIFFCIHFPMHFKAFFRLHFYWKYCYEGENKPFHLLKFSMVSTTDPQRHRQVRQSKLVWQPFGVCDILLCCAYRSAYYIEVSRERGERRFVLNRACTSLSRSHDVTYYSVRAAPHELQQSAVQPRTDRRRYFTPKPTQGSFWLNSTISPKSRETVRSSPSSDGMATLTSERRAFAHKINR